MNTGSALARFTITLSQAVTEPVQVDWFTSDGTAKAGVDFAANKGTALFSPGETSKTVDILVYGRAVGSEDRSFFVEMLPPTNAILGSSIGECIITVDTSGSTPVTAIIVPTGPKGEKGDPGEDGVSPDPAEIANEVAPLIDVGSTSLTAEGTDTLGHPDATTVKAVARRVAYAGGAKIANVTLADGDNTISTGDLTGDAVNFAGAGFIPRILHAGAFSKPSWVLNDDGTITVFSAVAGDVLYAVEYDFVSDYNSRTAILNAAASTAEPGFYVKHKSFEAGSKQIRTTRDALKWEGAPVGQGPYFAWTGALPKEVPAGSTPASTGGIGAGAWKDVGNATYLFYLQGDDGFDNIGYKAKDVAGAVHHVLTDRYINRLDAVADFKADGTGATDSTLALKAFAAEATKTGYCEATIYGIFQVSDKITFENIKGLNLRGNAYIYATFETDDYVIGFKNGYGLRIDGRIDVSAQNEIGIAAAWKFWSDAAGFSFFNVRGAVASYARTGFQVGDMAHPDALVSEGTFFGCSTSACPNAIKVIGTQTYINTNSCDWVSGGENDLAVVTQYTVHAIGSNLKCIGGEIQHNNNVFGAAVLVEPITSPTYESPFANFSGLDVHVETAAARTMIANLNGVASPSSARCDVMWDGAKGYHSQDNGPLDFVHESAEEDYVGSIMVERERMYCNKEGGRIQLNIHAKKAHIYPPASGYGDGFVKGLQGYSGGILHFSRRPVYRVTNANGQAIGTSPTVVNWTQPQVSDDMYRWTANYSAGRFTVPLGGLKNVEVLANIRVGSGNVQLDVYVDSTVKTMGSLTALKSEVHVMLGDLNAGQIVDVRANASAATTTNGLSLEGMTIIAER